MATAGVVTIGVGVEPKIKPGYKTTEFWTTVLTHVVALLALFHPGLKTTNLMPIEQLGGVLAAAISTAAYGHSRAAVKSALGSAVTSLLDNAPGAPPPPG